MSEPTFPPHPHAGFSAVTYLFEDSGGALVNRDSLGDRSRIEPGALHWTQAARGIDVQGMTCGSCVRHVRSALLQVDGVDAVDMKLSEGKVNLSHDADDAPVPRLVEALAEAGYRASPVS